MTPNVRRYKQKKKNIANSNKTKKFFYNARKIKIKLRL